ncbi:effector-associated constant component EACC1 [Actinokineospora globicatena]|uniref:Caspase domain-containing protein n=1 Tax=Actinokineospora globicatena TaxID=103729 RepID=A0A9W6VA01_9PSEU|nr:esterase-like activity of phytase family protein [Actinokineospora globicatena]GLW92479.1 hypothetical protein Aglo03_32950 [Actinokineospora globicatena]
MDAIEFRFEAGDDEGSRDLRSLARHLAGDHELLANARVVVQSDAVASGEMGAAEFVMAAVSAVAGVGQLAVAVRAWRDQLNRPTGIRVVVPAGNRDAGDAVVDALRGATAQPVEPKARAEAQHRIDPANSACVLIGVDNYLDGDLPSLRAVHNNVEQLHGVLTDDAIWGIEPGRIRKVHNPRSAAELIRPIREMSELATDTLVVYYAGHGLKDLEENELYLALPGSVPGQPETAVRYKAVKQAIAQSRHALRVVIVLDCCYSGVALDGAMAQAVDDIRADAGIDDVRGSYLMCAAAPNRKALAPNPDKCTVFTGAVVDVLREGVADEPGPMLSLGVVFREVRRRLHRERSPEPQQQDQNQVGDLPFAHNIARAPKPEVVEAVPARRRRSWAAVVLTALVAFGAGYAVRPGIDLAQRLFPGPTAPPAAAVPPGGPCSPNATLLSYSDQLNGIAIGNEKVAGLSALAVSTKPGDPRIYALADNAPGRVFPLTLGNPGQLDVSAALATTLKGFSGPNPLGDIDSEGLVFEPEGDTVLVSTERPTNIRRFDITSGNEVPVAIRFPQNLQVDPDNPRAEASGRTIESLAMTPGGGHLFAGWEGPLSGDGDRQGRNLVRIQRFSRGEGRSYEPRLLALERQYIDGLRNA